MPVQIENEESPHMNISPVPEDLSNKVPGKQSKTILIVDRYTEGNDGLFQKTPSFHRLAVIQLQLQFRIAPA